MALNTGDKIGRYEITALLGKGGMGEVYRARDPQLKREVAIKLSLAQFTDRFRREAEAVAALNHPNVCMLFDVGQDHLVMELVNGPTLAERMATDAIPLEEALAIARQIAAALEHAHSRGVIHRDLKPENVKLAPDGTVKVLDFGLAKVAPLSAGGSRADDGSSLTADLTEAGVILGTAAYMSPEQVAGQEVDKRADIWAFGVVLYEMLAGASLFRSDAAVDTLANVRMREPDWEKIPARARTLLKWCLEKSPARRLRDIGDARIFLEDGTDIPLHAEAPSTRVRNLGWVSAAAAALVAAWLWLNPGAVDQPLRMTSLLAPEGSEYRLVSIGTFLALPALSPDGKRLVFGARSPDGKASQLWIRSLDSLAAQPLPGTEGGSLPFWSPDGRYVAFESNIDRTLKKIDVSGGPPVTITPLTHSFRGGSWGAEGVIVFSQNGPESPIMKVPQTGGEATPATAVEKGKDTFGNRFPWFLPDGRHFLYLVPRSGGPSAVRVGSLDGGLNPGKVVAEAESNAIYSQGHLLYLRRRTLMAQPFDVEKLETTGDARAIAEGIPTTLQPDRVAHLTASTSGQLVYPGGVTRGSNSNLVSKDRNGKSIGTVEIVSGRFLDIQFSPDRKSLLASLSEGNNNNLWIYDVGKGDKTRFTYDAGAEPSAVWTPDGKTIIWRTGTGDLYRKASNLTGTDELLLSGPFLNPSSVSPDGKTLIYVKGGIDIWALPLAPAQTGSPQAVLETSSAESHAQFSPDGKWVAYTSDETVVREVYVISYPGRGGKRQISSGGATHARWRSDGRELFYVTRDGDLMAAEITLRGETLEVGRIQRLFGGVINTGVIGGDGYIYDVSLDGQSFVLALSDAATSNPATPASLTLVDNWTRLLSSAQGLGLK